MKPGAAARPGRRKRGPSARDLDRARGEVLADDARGARARASSGGRCAERRPLCESANATSGRDSAMREKASSQRANSVASLFRNLRRAGVLK